MLFIAFMLRPWILRCRAAGAKPRTLADDIMVYTTGPQHESIFEKAYDITHEYIEDMGAKLAPKKSATFSTVRVTRQKLRSHV